MLIAGFVHGTISDIDDPEGLGRCRVAVPGIFEDGTPYWCVPGHWPGGGGTEYGSWYPLPLGAQVGVIFEFGNPEAGAMFFPTVYGRDDDGKAVGPTAMKALQPEQRNRRVVLWDDDVFTIYTTLEGDPSGGRVLVFMDKESGTSITMDARDGNDKKAKSIGIDAQTGIVLRTDGRIDLVGSQIYIHGRKVTHGGGDI